MGQEVSIQLAEFVAGSKYEDFPAAVVDFAKGTLLKTVAGMLVGSKKAAGKKISGLVKSRQLPTEVGVIGNGYKTTLWEAAMLHGYFAHASELEDDRFGDNVSWDITVIPPVWSIADKLGLSGKRVLEAMILGLEVHVRTCLFSGPNMDIMIPTGTMGAAAGVGKALGLKSGEINYAMGLCMSGVPMSLANFGTDAHYFESALHCMLGTMAAEGAQRGMTSNPDVVKYLNRFCGKEKVFPEKMVAGLGKEWLFKGIWIKKYPACFLTHRQIDALIELRNQHHLSYEQVDCVEMHGGLADKACDRPDPRIEPDLQFSYQHVLAAAMLDGDVRLDHISPAMIEDPRMKSARSKVKVILHPDWPRWFPEAPCRIVVKTKDGREFSRERMYIIGSPQEPLTLDQVSGLYSKFTSGLLSPEDISRTADAIRNLEKLHDVREVAETLTFRSKG